MARESELWDWLKLHPAAKDGTCMDLHMERVENIVGKATPDVEGCYKGGTFQLETKVLHQIRKSGASGEIRFEKGQREWGQRRWLAGGPSYALIASPDRVWLVPGLFLPSLPLRGPVTYAEMDARCVLTMGVDSDSHGRRTTARDAYTLAIMFQLLETPIIPRVFAKQLAEATPEIDLIALSPVESVLIAEGLIGQRFGQGASPMRAFDIL